jgi:hypothetical protein
MGVPRFAELIRTKYPKCWYNEGESLVFDSTGKLLGQEVGTLFIDGNGLLHPAMQYTFGYGEFSKKEYSNLSEEEIVRIGAKNFMNAVRSLCQEFRPEKVVVAIDGPAPIAKMIQQRQRRFGAKMDVTETPDFKTAWADMIRRSRTKATEDEQTYVTLFIAPDAGQIIERSTVQAGSIESEIYRRIRAMIEVNLVDWARKEGVIWYNLLSHDCPVGFEYNGRWWWSVGSCACAHVWKEVYGKDTFMNLFSSDTRLQHTLEDVRNHAYVGTNRPKGSVSDTIIHNWVKFKEENSVFVRDNKDMIADMCKTISKHLCAKYRIYRECLLNTGIGTSLQGPDRARIEWLMSVRQELMQEMEPSRLEKDLPTEYEEGFTEGIRETASNVFDSNSLTPGTSVMKIIDEYIKSATRDGTLAGVEFVYSDHMTPGEGEHKIMNYIDRMPEDKKIHLVYGLDADLFMLCLIRNANLALIRENRTNTDKFRGELPERKPKTSSCHVVSINRLKKDLPEYGFQVNHLDFVFICFMFGNDFLRNIPCLYFDRNLDAVIDNDNTINAMDYIFTIYNTLREGRGSVFVSQHRGAPLYIRWLKFYRFVSELAKIEKQIFSGIIRRMRSEEAAEMKMGQKQKPGHVPVRLQYEVLLKSIKIRQRIEGGVINQRARYVDDTEGFDYEEFKEEWARHITRNIPGMERDSVSATFSRSNKRDVLKKMSRTFFEGMEWTMRYYTNMHTLANSKSILNANWYYPYSQAPLMSHLEEFLYEFIQEDARTLNASLGESSREALFYYLYGQKITTGIKKRATKTEVDILNSYPEDIFIKQIKQSRDEMINERLLMRQTPREQVPSNIKRLYSGVRVGSYEGENVFCRGWADPKFLFSKSQMKDPLISISSTSPEVQLLAVLPAQSSKYFPVNTSPAELSWMYPSAMPVDFNFKGKTYAAVISLPPPNIPFLEGYWIDKKSAMFSEGAQPPIEGVLIDDITDKNRINYESLADFFRMNLDGSKKCMVYSTPSGLAAMALSQFFDEVVIFSNTRTKDHTTYLKPNMERFANQRSGKFSYSTTKIESLPNDIGLVYVEGFDRKGRSWFHMDPSKSLEDIVAETVTPKRGLVVRVPSPRYTPPRLNSREIRMIKHVDNHETYLYFTLEEEMPEDDDDRRSERSDDEGFRESLDDITGVTGFRLPPGITPSNLPRKMDLEAVLENENVGGENIRDIVVYNFQDGGILANALAERYSNVVVYESSEINSEVVSHNFPDLQVEVGRPEPAENTLYFTTSSMPFRDYIPGGSNSIVVVRADYRSSDEMRGYIDRISPRKETIYSNFYNLYVFGAE